MKIALGELGWPPDQAYWTDVNAIILASEGRADLLCRIGLMRRKDPSLTTARPPRDARGRPSSFEAAFERRISAMNARRRSSKPR